LMFCFDINQLIFVESLKFTAANGSRNSKTFDINYKRTNNAEKKDKYHFLTHPPCASTTTTTTTKMAISYYNSLAGALSAMVFHFGKSTDVVLLSGFMLTRNWESLRRFAITYINPTIVIISVCIFRLLSLINDLWEYRYLKYFNMNTNCQNFR